MHGVRSAIRPPAMPHAKITHKEYSGLAGMSVVSVSVGDVIWPELSLRRVFFASVSVAVDESV